MPNFEFKLFGDIAKRLTPLLLFGFGIAIVFYLCFRNSHDLTQENIIIISILVIFLVTVIYWSKNEDRKLRRASDASDLDHRTEELNKFR